MEGLRAKRAIDLLLFASLSAALLSFGLQGGELLKEDYIGLALAGGLILVLFIIKRGALLAKDYGTAAMSLGFIFVLSRSLRLSLISDLLKGFSLQPFFLFTIMAALFLIVGLVLNKSSFVLFNSLVDWSFLGALLFIFIFSPFVLLLSGGEKAAYYKVSFPLYLITGEFFCFYLTINFLLRRGKYRRSFLILFIVLLLIIFWHPLGK
ncbi:MAG: hypothetical protein ACETWC_08575 [Acidobacteriota bacterium]